MNSIDNKIREAGSEEERVILKENEGLTAVTATNGHADETKHPARNKNKRWIAAFFGKPTKPDDTFSSGAPPL